jgi:hypothetical protein
VSTPSRAWRLAALLALTAGCATQPAKAPPPKTAAQAPAAPLPTDIRVTALDELPGTAPAAWAFTTTDLHTSGHPELVLIVKRAPGEGEGAYPADGVEILNTLAMAVRKGRRFKEWELAGIPQGMFDRGDLTGIVLGGAVLDARLKVAGPTMTVLLITTDELNVAFQFGAPRVMNLLGHREPFFPYPPWVDRTRPSVCTPAQMKDSPVAKVGRREWIRGAAVWQDLQAKPRRITLSLTREAAQHVAQVLRSVDANRLAFFPLAPAADADTRLVYTRLGEIPIAISRGTDGAANPATKLAGNFVVLASSDDSAGAVLAEDGFSAFIPDARWGEAVAALEAGRSFDVAATEGSLPFGIVVEAR